MPYLGKSPSQGVRSRYYFTATGGETSLSGTDDNSNTLVFSDGEYVDVSLNGVALVAGTDYNTTTANTIGGLSALTTSDVVEVIVYDTFSVFSGDVNGDFSVGANLSVTGTTALTGNATLTGDLTVDTTTLVVDATNNRVGMGIASAEATLDLVGNSDSVAALKIGPNASFGHHFYDSSTNGDLVVKREVSGTQTEVMRLTRANGLARFSEGVLFGTDTAAANALDDYEEGDWDPDIRQSGTAVSDAAYNTSFNAGQYTKVGRVVHATGTLRITSKGTVTGTNTFQVGGLPFASTNDVKARSPVNIYNHLGAGIDMTGNTNGTLMGFLTHNSDEIVFRVDDFSGTTGEIVQFNDVSDTLYLQLSIFYITG